jgi:hypothetical protein
MQSSEAVGQTPAQRIVAVESGGSSDFWAGKSYRREQPEFMKKAETARLLATGEPFEITDARYGEITNKKDGSTKEVGYIDVTLSGGEERTKSFDLGSKSGRDELIRDLCEHFHGGGAPVQARFVEWGPAIGIEAVS